MILRLLNVVETSGDYRQYLSSSFLVAPHLHTVWNIPGIMTIVESVNEWPLAHGLNHFFVLLCEAKKQVWLITSEPQIP